MCGRIESKPAAEVEHEFTRGDRIVVQADSDLAGDNVKAGTRGEYDESPGSGSAHIPWVVLDDGRRVIVEASNLAPEPAEAEVKVGQVRSWNNSPAETITIERITDGEAFYAYPPSYPGAPDSYRTRSSRTVTAIARDTSLVEEAPAQSEPLPAALAHIPPRSAFRISEAGVWEFGTAEAPETEEVTIHQKTDLREGDVVLTAPNEGTPAAHLVPVTVRREVTPEPAKPAPGTFGTAVVDGERVRGFIDTDGELAYPSPDGSAGVHYSGDLTDFVPDAEPALPSREALAAVIKHLARRSEDFSHTYRVDPLRAADRVLALLKETR